VIFKRPTLVGGTVNISTGTGDAPVIEDCPGARTTGQGQLVQFSVTATDPNGDNLSLTLESPCGGDLHSVQSGQRQHIGDRDFSVDTLNKPARQLFRQLPRDRPGSLSSPFCTVSITVQEGVEGNPPDVTCQASTLTIDQGQLVEFNVSASDVDGDTLILTASNLPLGATFTPMNPMHGLGPLTGTFGWTPSFTQSGAFTVSFNAEDENGNEDICNTTIIVNEVEIDQLFTTSAAGQRPQGVLRALRMSLFQSISSPRRQSMACNSTSSTIRPFLRRPRCRRAIAWTAFPFAKTWERIRGGFASWHSISAARQLARAPRRCCLTSSGMSIRSDAGSYPIEFENAWESINPDPETPSLPLATTNGIIVVDNLGDANLDTRIDVADVVAVIGIFSTITRSTCASSSRVTWWWTLFWTSSTFRGSSI